PAISIEAAAHAPAWPNVSRQNAKRCAWRHVPARRAPFSTHRESARAGHLPCRSASIPMLLVLVNRESRPGFEKVFWLSCGGRARQDAGRLLCTRKRATGSAAAPLADRARLLRPAKQATVRVPSAHAPSDEAGLSSLHLLREAE